MQIQIQMQSELQIHLQAKDTARATHAAVDTTVGIAKDTFRAVDTLAGKP